MLLAAAVAAGVLVTSPGDARAACSSACTANGKIAFTSNRDGNQEIYVMNPDGSGQTRLTNNPASDSSPSWSPGGTKIAFMSLRSGAPAIWVMNANGSNPTFVHGADPTSVLSWSPNGTKILFQSVALDGSPEIGVVNVDGSEATNLTDNAGADVKADWSPAGTIAFENIFGHDDIYVMNADGSNQVRLTDQEPYFSGFPKWSPSGKKIAFESNRPPDGRGFYVMNADGSDQEPLMTTDATALALDWSPNGAKIVFQSSRDGNPEIYAMNADGSGQTRLTVNPAGDFDPDWQPIFLAKVPSTASPPTGPPGSIFKWRAGGFSAGEPVILRFDDGRIGVKVANAAGGFQAVLRVPRSARPGKHALTAVGRWSGAAAHAVFVVKARTTRR
jgi:Tol biopolymer transport system component